MYILIVKFSNLSCLLNNELEKQGYMRFPQGRVPKKYFEERYYLEEKVEA